MRVYVCAGVHVVCFVELLDMLIMWYEVSCESSPGCLLHVVSGHWCSEDSVCCSPYIPKWTSALSHLYWPILMLH